MLRQLLSVALLRSLWCERSLGSAVTDALRELAAELAIEPADGYMLVRPAVDAYARAAIAELVSAVETAHLSPETRARVACHLDRLRSVAAAHERMVGGSAPAQEAAP